MNNDPSSPSADLDELRGRRAVSAYFQSREAAEKAEADLAAAGFASGTVYLIPREPGFAVTATNPDRVAEATQVLRAAGGEIRLAEKEPESAASAANASPKIPTQEPATGDSIGGGMFTPGSSAGGAGAGTATGGVLY